LADLFRPGRDIALWDRLPDAVRAWPVADILDLIEWLPQLEAHLRGAPKPIPSLQERWDGLTLLETWPVPIEFLLSRHWRSRGTKSRLGRVLVLGELETILQSLRSQRARDFVSPVVRQVRR
jgi:hypothetical protein